MDIGVAYQVKDQSGRVMGQNMTVNETVSVVDQNQTTKAKMHNGDNITNPAGVFIDGVAIIGTAALPSNTCSIVKQILSVTGHTIRVNCVRFTSTNVIITDVTSNPTTCSQPTYHCN